MINLANVFFSDQIEISCKTQWPKNYLTLNNNNIKVDLFIATKNFITIFRCWQSDILNYSNIQGGVQNWMQSVLYTQFSYNLLIVWVVLFVCYECNS